MAIKNEKYAMTLEKYKAIKKVIADTEKIIENYKVCGNYGSADVGVGCNKLFKTVDLIKTIYYTQVYYWCKDCYLKIKDD